MKKNLIFLFISLTLISCGKRNDWESVVLPSSEGAKKETQETSTQALSVPAVAPWTIEEKKWSTLEATWTQIEVPDWTPKDIITENIKVATELPKIDDPAKINTPIMTQKQKTIVLKLWKNEFQTEKNNVVTLNNILSWTKLSSKVHLTGKVPINWVFEGTFPIKIYDIGNWILWEWLWKANIFDKNGKVIDDKVVSFEADIDLIIPALTKKWILILSADNPSGMPENADSVSIKVVF